MRKRAGRFLIIFKSEENLMKHFKLLLLILLVIACLFLAACEDKPVITDPNGQPGEDPGENPGEDPGENPGEDPGEDPGKDPGEDPGETTFWYNPATNLPLKEALAAQRPVAIMINNLKTALPQEGIAKADLYFEMPTEGATNRIMALFYDYAAVGNIGTVRSARDYYLDYILPYDALLLHYGGSPQFYVLSKLYKIDAFDGIDGTVESRLYWRDAARIQRSGSEHSVLTSGTRIDAAISSFGVRRSAEEPYHPYFLFAEESDLPEEVDVQSVTLKFSGYITVNFDYDAASGKYLRSQYGEPHIDSSSGEQIAVTNVIVIQTSVTPIPGDDSQRLDIKTNGTGGGYYISRGRAQLITWRKDNVYSPLKLYDEFGEEISINSGKSWFMITDKEPELN